MLYKLAGCEARDFRSLIRSLDSAIVFSYELTSKWMQLVGGGWHQLDNLSYPIGSMYGIFTYIYHKNQPKEGKYTIHGWYGYM